MALEPNQQLCPLSNDLADVGRFDSGVRKIYYCPTCVRLVTTRAAEKYISAQTEVWLKERSEKARAVSDDDILEIAANTSQGKPAELIDRVICRTGSML